MENVLTLGKLLSLGFCFSPPLFYLFLISQTSYRTYKIFQELARPVMGTILVKGSSMWNKLQNSKGSGVSASTGAKKKYVATT